MPIVGVGTYLVCLKLSYALRKFEKIYLFFWYSVNRCWSWKPCEWCNRCRLSSYWYSLSIWDRKRCGTSSSKENCRWSHQTGGHFCCNQSMNKCSHLKREQFHFNSINILAMEHISQARFSGTSIQSILRKFGFGLHWFVFDAFPRSLSTRSERSIAGSQRCRFVSTNSKG